MRSPHRVTPAAMSPSIHGSYLGQSVVAAVVTLRLVPRTEPPEARNSAASSLRRAAQRRR
ncbi:hypothetical protein [Mycolicibacterium hippocampi]|uniref:hypothetical protein n=1 Tax=Mycolicibacterium hippocampi TaxID=659824 RepID=UPI0035136ED2